MCSHTCALSRRLLPALLALAAALAAVPGSGATVSSSPGPGTALALGQNPVALAVDRRDRLACVVVHGPQDIFGRYSGNGLVRIIALPRGRIVHSATVGAEPVAVVVDERSGHVFIANSVSSGLIVLDTRTDKVAQAIALRAPVTTLTSDGRGHVVALDTRNTISVLDGRSGRVIRTVAALSAGGSAGSGSALALAIGGQGRRAFVVADAAGRQRHRVYGIDLSGASSTALYRASIPGDAIDGVAWDAGSRRLLVVSARAQAPATATSLLGAGWLSLIS